MGWAEVTPPKETAREEGLVTAWPCTGIAGELRWVIGVGAAAEICTLPPPGVQAGAETPEIALEGLTLRDARYTPPATTVEPEAAWLTACGAKES
mmetsp:Transcript_3835/g.8670  ORF Transcript_3835/g.8670 Transcript_3835/m.8670 type:complete len:95 (-) Transcript_3835:1557-1841(-)